VRTYVLSGPQFDSLAGGCGSADAIELLAASQRVRRMLLVLAGVECAARLDGRAAAPLNETLGLLTRLELEVPAAVEDVFRHPFVAAWYRALAEGDEAGSGRVAAAAEYLAGLVAGAAVRAGASFATTVAVRGRDLLLPSLGRVAGVGPGDVRIACDGSVLVVRGAAGEVRVPVPAAGAVPGWRPLGAVTVTAAGRTWTVRIDDMDPHRDRFAARPASWPTNGARGHLREAWWLLAAEQPLYAEAIVATVGTLVPVEGEDPGRDSSASARDAYGAIAVSAPSDPERLAELLIHEHQHLVLAALLDLVPLCRPAGPAVHYAPWRPDRPRPAGPLLQGIYAYTGVADFWRGRRRSLHGRAAVRAAYLFAYWRLQVAAALDGLAGAAELTAEGARFCAGLRATLDLWLAEPIDAVAERPARLAALADRVTWCLGHQATDPAELAVLAGAWRAGAACPPLGVAPIALSGRPPPSRLATLGDRWADAALATDPGVAALLGDTCARAAVLFGRYGGVTDWTGLVVAAHAGDLPGHRAAVRRPALLRDLTGRLRDAEAVTDALAVARWLEAAAAT
jgi:uncharacterized protein